MNKEIAPVLEQDEISHIEEINNPDNENSPSFVDINGKKELLQVTGLQGKYECTCGNSHATIVNSMTNNDICNVLLLLDNEQWMVT